jgi:hypothetical protein
MIRFKNNKTKKQTIQNKHLKLYYGGKWSRKYKMSINCKNPKGFSQRQYCNHGIHKRQKKKY